MWISHKQEQTGAELSPCLSPLHAPVYAAPCLLSTYSRAAPVLRCLPLLAACCTRCYSLGGTRTRPLEPGAGMRWAAETPRYGRCRRAVCGLHQAKSSGHSEAASWRDGERGIRPLWMHIKRPLAPLRATHPPPTSLHRSTHCEQASMARALCVAALAGALLLNLAAAAFAPRQAGRR